MRRQMILAAMTLTLVGSAVAYFPPGRDVDYSSLPRPLGEVEAEIRACKVTLTTAVAKAEKEVGGIAASAELDVNVEPPVIDVVVYADQNARHVTINANSGEIVANEAMSRFPGDAVSGQPQARQSGLQYFVIAEGMGEAPSGPDATVHVHLTVWLVDGAEVLNTRAGSPMQIQLGNPSLIRGVAEALAEMKVGEKRKLLIPPELAFGARSTGQIPANATLIADVEVVAAPDFVTVPPLAELPGEAVVGGLVELESGLQYYDIREGDGPTPMDEASNVKVHYTGWLVNGTKFDSSVDSGQPFTTPLTRVIPGWREGVGSMKVGGKRKLIIPGALAYGPQGQPPTIPPNATLIFDIELLEIIGE